ncbi:MAG: hypothetical protein LBI95_00785 [Holosporales bacterium]|jgi:hypothetical protein|nr:hypothetical protein [Holosporales bacterium]
MRVFALAISVIVILFYPDKLYAQKMPFQIGFEFQLNNTSCPWAESNYNFQKKRIITVKWKKNEIFHIELDGPEIELITVPFPYTEREKLKNCIFAIQEVIKLLEKGIIIKFEASEEGGVGEFFAETEKDPNMTFNDLVTELSKTLKEDFLVEGGGEVWEKVKDFEITSKDKWGEISPQPQVTIQHPLEYTIELCKYLSSTDLEINKVLNDSSELTVAEEVLPIKIPDKYSMRNLTRRKLAGLMFLQAHTISEMTKSVFNQGRILTDVELLSKTCNQARSNSQLDVKRMISFMSRRPFSKMLLEVNANVDYSKAFEAAINGAFIWKKINPKGNFYRSEYAEEHYDSSTGRRLDFTELLNEDWDKDFLNDKRVEIEELLKKGIVSTAMVRHLQTSATRLWPAPPHIKHSSSHAESYKGTSYYNSVISSVKNPGYLRFFVCKKDRSAGQNLWIGFKEWGYDLLSPPYLLEYDDSMGRLKIQHNPTYGEAIVEFRDIERAVYVHTSNPDKYNAAGFLLARANTLSRDALFLFDFLCKLFDNQNR